MSVVIRVKDLVKKYNIYDEPIDRLKEIFSIRKKSYHREFVALNGLTFDVEKGDAKIDDQFNGRLYTTKQNNIQLN